MNTFQAIILGIVQGLTEFLPVSSSGHLALVRQLFGLQEPDLFFDASVHVGTMLAVLIVFRADLFNIFRALLRTIVPGSFKSLRMKNHDDRAGRKFARFVAVGSIPTAVIGLIFKTQLADMFASLYLVSAMYFATAAIIWLTRGRGAGGQRITAFSDGKALIAGCVQGLAVLPGLSRSGATIAAGLFLGLDRETAARYSFLLCIPAIIGAELLLSSEELFFAESTATAAVILTGAASSFAVGYLALKVLLKIVSRGKLYLFTPYCLAVGLAALIYAAYQ